MGVYWLMVAHIVGLRVAMAHPFCEHANVIVPQDTHCFISTSYYSLMSVARFKIRARTIVPAYTPHLVQPCAYALTVVYLYVLYVSLLQATAVRLHYCWDLSITGQLQ
jgi:hypothetical protein